MVGPTNGQLIEIQNQLHSFNPKSSSQMESYSCRSSPVEFRSQVGRGTSTLLSNQATRDVVFEESRRRNADVQRQRGDVVDDQSHLSTSPNVSVGCVWNQSVAGGHSTMSDQMVSTVQPYTSGDARPVDKETLNEDA